MLLLPAPILRPPICVANSNIRTCTENEDVRKFLRPDHCHPGVSCTSNSPLEPFLSVSNAEKAIAGPKAVVDESGSELSERYSQPLEALAVEMGLTITIKSQSYRWIHRQNIKTGTMKPAHVRAQSTPFDRTCRCRCLASVSAFAASPSGSTT